jgi:hypothetical protein
MSVPHENQPDQTRIVAQLAVASQLPVDDVARIYEQERAQLATGAHITTFLHIFAMRNVQEILRRQALGELAAPAGVRPLFVV